jgi:dihydrofolate reductase
MRISAIVAMSTNRVIGSENQIPWHLPADLKFFQQTTMGHHVIMGRKNYQSIGRPLKGRTNIVITRDPFFVSSGCLVVHSLEEALAIAQRNQDAEPFVIGGGEIYRLAMDYLDRIYLTQVDVVVSGDVYFPEFDIDQWRLVSETIHPADARNAHTFTIRVLDRIIPHST